MTLVEPYYRLLSGRPISACGVKFLPYSTGILTYARVSEDGRCKVRIANRYSEKGTTYSAEVEGHGVILSPNGRSKRFRSEIAAMAAAVKLAERLKP